MNKVLFISYIYPPIAGGGVFRSLKFTKYLPNYGWQPVVISINKSKFSPMDSTLLDDVPDIVKVYRTKSIESKIYAYAPSHLGINTKWYQVPDKFLGWMPFALSKAMEVIKLEKPKVIFSTSPPATSHLIAYFLKKKTGLPWVADFRDPWTDNFMIKYPTKTHQKIEELMEHKVLKYADRIVFVIDQHRKHILDKYPNISSDKCVTITNGYDPDDFKGGKIGRFSKFTITYVGSFYGSQSPEYFLQAAHDAIEENEHLKNDFQIKIIGKSSKELQNLGNKFGLYGYVKELGYQPHKKAIEYMKKSSSLFFVIGFGKKNDWVYTGKIYEYMSSGTPILATVPNNSPVKEIINSTKTGVVVDTDDVDGIKNAILKYYEKWKKEEYHFSPNWREIKKFDREKLTEKLSKQFDRLC